MKRASAYRWTHWKAPRTRQPSNGHCRGCRSRLIAWLRGHQRAQERWMRVAQEPAVDAGARGLWR